MAITGAVAAAVRKFDPYPRALLALDFAGLNPSGRPFYKREGIIVPRFEMLRGATSVGHAGFGTTLVNGAYRSFAPDAPLIGDGGLGVWEARLNEAPSPQNFTTANGYLLSEVTTSLTLTPGGQMTFGDVSEFGTDDALRRMRARAFGVTAGNTRTFSFRVKGGKGRDFFAIRTSAQDVAGPFRSSVFNLATGAVSSQSTGQVAQISPERGGWFRCSLQVTPATTGGTELYVGFPPADVGANTLGVSWVGEPTKGGDLWAFNDTIGPDINDPPILQTTGLPATRTAVAQSVGGLTPPSGDWTISGSVELFGSTGATQRFVDWNDGSDANKISIERNSADGVQFRVIVGATTVAVVGGTYAGKGGARIIDWSLSRVGGDFVSVCDGVQGPPASVAAPTPTGVQLGAFRGGGGGWLNGKLRNLSLRYS